MENITHAKRELFESLRARCKGITGAGIKQKNGHDYIVVYIDSQDQKQFVPHRFMGNKVVSEVRGPIKAL